MFWRGRDRGFVLYISLFLQVLGWVGGCVLVYARTHTQTTRLLDVSPGVGRTPGEPEESRSTKAQYTCTPHRCTQYICLSICCIAVFGCFFLLTCLFFLEKVEDVTTISKSQTLTSVSIKDCTLRVPNKTTTLFLYEE